MKTVIIYSGGLDSTVLLYKLRAEGHELHSLTIDYGQRHHCEISYATNICKILGIENRVADLSSIRPLLAGSSLTSMDIEVPEGHYTEESMKSTIVPNRNMILLSIATGYALSIGALNLAYAAHQGDFAVYPDCRNEFAEALAKAIHLADWNKVDLIRPFVDNTKADIVRCGTGMNVPFELTWSCYKGGSNHCGRCGTCIERREAFDLANVEDPTVYANDAPSVASLRANNWRL